MADVPHIRGIPEHLRAFCQLCPHEADSLEAIADHLEQEHGHSAQRWPRRRARSGPRRGRAGHRGRTPGRRQRFRLELRAGPGNRPRPRSYTLPAAGPGTEASSGDAPANQPKEGL